MAAIKAFVGHSFAEVDAEVVRVFLDYLNEVSAIHSPFSWDHAEEAEPRPLTEKILEIIDDKNVLIAICTFKEYAIEKLSLLNTIFPRGFRKAKTDDFKGKASDWVNPGIPMEATSHNLIYTGVVDGFVVSGTVRHEPAKKTASSALGLLSGGTSSPFVGYIRDDRSAIEILEDHSSASTKYYSIKRR
jgi:hypothetical protein